MKKAGFRLGAVFLLLLALALSLFNSVIAAPAGLTTTTADGSAQDNTLDFAGMNGGLMQFTSAGHVLGFTADGIIVASTDHIMRVEFLNSMAVVPEADESSSGEPNDGMIPPLHRVTYQNVWEGVTVVYEASDGTIVKSTYYLDATEMGVPADRILLRYNRPVSVDGQGNLVIAYDNGIIMESTPLAWQEVAGERKSVTAAYVLYGDREVGFALGDYLPGIPVVIDPGTTWNTFLGD